IAVVGKPNVGKSSFINALLGETRNIVNETAGTTRDALLTRYQAFNFDFFLVDTAGIRKRSKVHEDIEFYSVLRSIRAIEESDVCLMMIDAREGMQKQDLNIFYTVEKNSKGIVILVNKWDLIEKETQTTKEFEDEIRERIAPFTDVPIVFISALTKQRIHKAVEKAMDVYNAIKTRIPTSQLNEVFQPILERNPPPRDRKSTRLNSSHVKISYAVFCLKKKT